MRTEVTEQTIFGVSALNTYISNIMKRDPMLKHVKLRGEIGSFTAQISSGHWYITLKDESSKLECVMYRFNNMKVRFRPETGMKVVVTGHVDVWPTSGRMQLYIDSMIPDGIGELYVQFEKLKNKLAAEGLFDPSRKKILPLMPRKIAVVTSESGAVYHDIVNVSGNRNPGVPIVLIPVPVQGAGAEIEIAEGIRIAQRIPDVDVIIVGRGGGSMEDLWCFNEEILARVISECTIPVISAVGHETDYTICDLVADQRASTPSNAAEIAVPTREELTDKIELLRSRMFTVLSGKASGFMLRAMELEKKIRRFEPTGRLAQISESVIKLKLEFGRQMDIRIEREGKFVQELMQRLDQSVDGILKEKTDRLVRYGEKLKAYSPLNVLDRGYAIVTGPEGKTVTSVIDAEQEKLLTLRFHDGQIETERREIHE